MKQEGGLGACCHRGDPDLLDPLEYYFASIPKQFHVINSRIVWLIVTAVVVQFAATFLMPAARLQAGGIVLVATVLMFVFRALAFVGLAVSFKRCQWAGTGRFHFAARHGHGLDRIVARHAGGAVHFGG